MPKSRFGRFLLISLCFRVKHQAIHTSNPLGLHRQVFPTNIRNMTFYPPTRFSPKQRSAAQLFGIVLLVLALVSSPFQYALGSCNCPGCQCCAQASSTESSEASTSCCCCSEVTKSTKSEGNDTCCLGCKTCGSQCQCGAIEITSSNHQIAKTGTAGSSWLPLELVSSFTDNSLTTTQSGKVLFPDLVSLRLHAFLCVWLN